MPHDYQKYRCQSCGGIVPVDDQRLAHPHHSDRHMGSHGVENGVVTMRARTPFCPGSARPALAVKA